MGKLWRADDVLSEKDLILPGVTPANLRLGGPFKSTMITSDVFNICERLAELNPRLEIHFLWDERKGGDSGYVVMERISHDESQVVFKTRQLDGRTVEQVRYLLSVPFAERFAQSQKILDKLAKDEHEAELDELYERLGAPMLRQLFHDGFIDGAKPNANLPYKRKRTK